MDDRINSHSTNKDIEEKIKKLDKESATVEYTGFWGKLISCICICFSLFHIYTGFFGTFDAMIQRCIHLSFGISLVFLLCPTSYYISYSSVVYTVKLSITNSTCRDCNTS